MKYNCQIRPAAKVTFGWRPNGVRVSEEKCLRERENSLCRGSEMGEGLVCLRKGKE